MFVYLCINNTVDLFGYNIRYNKCLHKRKTASYISVKDCSEERKTRLELATPTLARVDKLRNAKFPHSPAQYTLLAILLVC